MYKLKLGESLNTLVRIFLSKKDESRYRLFWLNFFFFFNFFIPFFIDLKPTIGFNVEQVQYKNITLSLWDIGGQSRYVLKMKEYNWRQKALMKIIFFNFFNGVQRIRPLWKHYFPGSHAIIYVVVSLLGRRVWKRNDNFFFARNRTRTIVRACPRRAPSCTISSTRSSYRARRSSSLPISRWERRIAF